MRQKRKQHAACQIFAAHGMPATCCLLFLGIIPMAEIFLLMAATSQSNSLAYKFLAKASLETEAAAASSCFTMRSPNVSMALVVNAVISWSGDTCNIAFFCHRGESVVHKLPEAKQGSALTSYAFVTRQSVLFTDCLEPNRAVP